MSKIGIGIITCNREDFLQTSYMSVAVSSAIQLHDCFVVNDGDPLSDETRNIIGLSDDNLIQHKKNCGVAVSKNNALKRMMDNGCDHLFLMEDDIKLTNISTIPKYIEVAEKSGIQHLNYGGHGIYNRTKQGEIVTRATVKVKDSDISLNLYYNILGAFSYYSREVIEKVGYMDETFHNAMEHVDHTYQIIKAGFHPPYWWFADLANSWEYIDDIKPFHQESVIRKNHDEWMENYKIASEYFATKNGHFPTAVPDPGQAVVGQSLKFLRDKYGN